MAARTDYVVLGPKSCLLMLTANKADGNEGHVMAVKTADGGNSNDTNQPQVLHTSKGKFTDKTCLMAGRSWRLA